MMGRNVNIDRQGGGGRITCGDRKFMRGGEVSCRGNTLPSPFSPFSAARDPF